VKLKRIAKINVTYFLPYSKISVFLVSDLAVFNFGSSHFIELMSFLVFFFVI